MRIDLTNAAASQILSDSSNADGVKANGTAAASSVDQQDRTTFSSQTDSLGSLVKTAMNSPEVRQDKIDSLKAAISNGTYELDPAKIAGSMLDEHA